MQEGRSNAKGRLYELIDAGYPASLTRQVRSGGRGSEVWRISQRSWTGATTR
jgi:hypothetical protein